MPAEFPLPVAALARRAQNARSPQERHLAAYHAWEASLRLAVAAAPPADLAPLALPSVGHYVRALAPPDAALDDPALVALYRVLAEHGLDQKANPRAVSPRRLFDALAAYRNRVIGHGASRPDAFYSAAGQALLDALDAAWRLGLFWPAGARLAHVDAVSIDAAGVRRARVLDLTGLASLVDAGAQAEAAPEGVLPGRCYLRAAGGYRPLHPWLVFQPLADRERVLFLDKVRPQPELLDYTTGDWVKGRVLDEAWPALAADVRDLFGAAAEAAPREAAGEAVTLALAVGAAGLRVAAHEGERAGTVRGYAEVALSPAELDGLAGGFAAYLRGDGARSYRQRLEEQGGELFRRAFSDAVQRKLAASRAPFLALELDGDLVHVPWELAHDGRAFLGLRFAVGRIVSAKLEEGTGGALRTATSGHALVVSNPSGDLPAAGREGKAVADLLRDGFGGEVRHLEGPVTKAAFLAALDGCRLLHFAGHARDGFVLAGGVALPAEVARAVGRAAPALVFANSCASSTAQGWAEAARGVGTLAQALLVQGVPHYLAPMWEIPDADALPFALRFWERALAGAAFGEAVQHARKALADGEARPLSFAGYVLYGDPRGGLPLSAAKLEPPGRTRSGPLSAVAAGPGPGAPSRGLPKWALQLFGFALVGASIAVSIVIHRRGAPPPPPPPAATAAGNMPSVKHEGPVRIAVLPFKNISKDAELAPLADGIAESIVTDFGHVDGVELIEHVQVDADIDYLGFANSKYVDPATRAAIGRIQGAEVVVLGGYQRQGKDVRAFARLVNPETGEVIEAVKAEGRAEKALDLQDDVAKKIGDAVRAAKARLRQ